MADDVVHVKVKLNDMAPKDAFRKSRDGMCYFFPVHFLACLIVTGCCLPALILCEFDLDLLIPLSFSFVITDHDYLVPQSDSDMPREAFFRRRSVCYIFTYVIVKE